MALSVTSSKIKSAAGAMQPQLFLALSTPQSSKKIPRNYLIGTKQFCIRFENKISYDNLPLNISNIVPEDVRNFVVNEIKTLRPARQGPLIDVNGEQKRTLPSRYLDRF